MCNACLPVERQSSWCSFSCHCELQTPPVAEQRVLQRVSFFCLSNTPNCCRRRRATPGYSHTVSFPVCKHPASVCSNGTAQIVQRFISSLERIGDMQDGWSCCLLPCLFSFALDPPPEKLYVMQESDNMRTLPPSLNGRMVKRESTCKRMLLSGVSGWWNGPPHRLSVPIPLCLRGFLTPQFPENIYSDAPLKHLKCAAVC